MNEEKANEAVRRYLVSNTAEIVNDLANYVQHITKHAYLSGYEDALMELQNSANTNNDEQV